MTKTLTEQWKKKELKDGDYYVRNKAGDIVCDYYIEILGHFDSVLTENVKEVLAPVPSYDVWKNIKEQWKVAIPQIERLQEQLKEANEVIKKYMSVAFEIRSKEEKPTVLQLAFYYLEKWGVK